MIPINPSGKYSAVDLGDYSPQHIRETVARCSGKPVLLSDHTMLPESEVTERGRVLAADGQYFSGRILNADADSFLFDYNGDKKRLDYKDIAGLLELVGEVPLAFPGRFRKRNGSNPVMPRTNSDWQREIRDSTGKVVLANIRGLERNCDYVVSRLYSAGENDFTLRIPNNPGVANFAYNSLIGIFLPVDGK